jgi:adenylate kinase
VDSDRSTLVADTKKVAKRLQELFTQSEGTVVVEGHYVVDVVPKKDVNIVFVLRRDPRELEMVLKSRGYSEKKVNENLAAEVLDVCLWDAVNACGEDKVCEIDVSNKTVDDVVNELLSVLQENKTCSYGTVDWLGTLELSGQLDEYLKKIG